MIGQDANRYCDRCGKVIQYSFQGGNEDPEVRIGKVHHDLCTSCKEKLLEQQERMLDQFTGIQEFTDAAISILKGLERMGCYVDSENFGDTPYRFARAYYEIFSGCVNAGQQIQTVLSTSFPAEGRDDMIVAKDIICFSMCPHHLLPVEYHVSVGYIPTKEGRVLGISKLARLVKILAKRPVLQEEFTHEIVNCLDQIKVQGAIACVEGHHMCMRMRGAEARESCIKTTAITGLFQEDTGAKAEFLEAIK